jgi:hypothetical protein
MHKEFQLENMEGRNYLGNLGINGGNNIKMELEEILQPG